MLGFLSKQKREYLSTYPFVKFLEKNKKKFVESLKSFFDESFIKDLQKHDFNEQEI